MNMYVTVYDYLHIVYNDHKYGNIVDSKNLTIKQSTLEISQKTYTQNLTKNNLHSKSHKISIAFEKGLPRSGHWWYGHALQV